MSDYYQGGAAPGPEQPSYGYAPPVGPPAAPAGYYPPAPYGSYPVAGPAPLGVIRSTGKSMFLYLITFGIYGIY